MCYLNLHVKKYETSAGNNMKRQKVSGLIFQCASEKAKVNSCRGKDTPKVCKMKRPSVRKKS